MKSGAEIQRRTLQQDRGPLISKLGIGLILLMGLVMIAAGIWGMNRFQASGFDAEDGFGAIRAASQAVEKDWQIKLQPILDSLPGDARATLDEKCDQMLTDLWEKQQKGAAPKVEAYLAGLPEAIYTALHTPCGVAEDPQTSIVLGCGRVLDNFNAYKTLLSDSRRSLR